MLPFFARRCWMGNRNFGRDGECICRVIDREYTDIGTKLTLRGTPPQRAHKAQTKDNGCGQYKLPLKGGKPSRELAAWPIASAWTAENFFGRRQSEVRDIDELKTASL